MTRFLAVLWLTFLALATPAFAQTFPPRPEAPVLDQAGLLRPEQLLDIQSKSEALHAQTGRAFVVATVNSLEGYPIEDYAYRLGRAWKIGDEKRDDGVLLLVAPNEKKVWIATGYGAEGFLPDILAGRITREIILPRFREGDMGGGIVAGADAIIRQMSADPEDAQRNVADARATARERSGDGAGFLPVLFIVIIFFAIIGSIARRAGGRRYRSRRYRDRGIDPWIVLWGLDALSRSSRGRGGWGGGGSWGGGGGFGGGGGGFGGFGGGSFGGGGAGGSW